MKNERTKEVKAQQLTDFHSLIDTSKRTGAVAHRVQRKEKTYTATDSMLAVYGNHFTFTFMLEREVASIHYDKRQREIFFKGHNIRHMELTGPEQQALMEVTEVLRSDEEGQQFAAEYEATLARLLADKK